MPQPEAIRGIFRCGIVSAHGKLAMLVLALAAAVLAVLLWNA